MENLNQETANLLNDLIEINNDRIEGYEKAISLLPKEGNYSIQAIFEKYRDQSIQFKNELIPLVFREGDVPTEDTRTRGKLFRAWMDIKSMIAPFTVKAILESCEAGEDEFRKVYKNTISKQEFIPFQILKVVESQATIQLEAYNHIKKVKNNIAT